MTSFKFTDGIQDVSTEITYPDEQKTLQSIHRSCHTMGNNGNADVYRCPPSERACFFNPRFFQSLSYQAVMDAVTTQISGQTSLDAYGAWSTTTNIQDTVLVQTPDMENIRIDQMRRGHSWERTFQGVIVEEQWLDRDEFHGLETTDKSTLALDLPEAVE
jgi:hypothetical protein